MKTFFALLLVFFLAGQYAEAQYATAQSTSVYSSRSGYAVNRSRVDVRLNPGVPSAGYAQYPPYIPQGYAPGMYYYPQFNGVYFSNGNSSMTMGTVTMTPVRPYYRRYR
jgi:hypothetical protein